MERARSIVAKPDPSEYPAWAQAEIALVEHTDLVSVLEECRNDSMAVLKGLDEAALRYRYAEGKWTIREIWQHIIDTERVLSYRAMRYSRGDQTVLSGFDAQKYTVASKPDERDWKAMLEEYAAVRTATICLFRSFDADMALLKGIAGRSEMTARAAGYLIAGHDRHHLNTIRTRYLQGGDK